MAGILASQCLAEDRFQNFAVEFNGRLPDACTSRDMAMEFIRRVGPGGARGTVVEFRGRAVRGLTMAARMTLCNLAIEAGARSALIGCDETTIGWLKERPGLRDRIDGPLLQHWQSMVSDPGAEFDRTLVIECRELQPLITWGISPDQSVPVGSRLPDPVTAAESGALAWMGWKPGQEILIRSISPMFSWTVISTFMPATRKQTG